MKNSLFILSVIIVIFSSCEKNTSNNCIDIASARAYSNSPITIGQTLKIWTNEIDGCTYQWTGPSSFSSQYAADSVSDAQINQSGWYYLRVYSLDNDCSKFDSVYVDVRLQQANEPCTVTPNNIIFSNIADMSFSTVYKGVESTYSLKSLYSSSSSGDVDIYFPPHWRDIEPADGLYTTYNSPLFDPVDPIYNKVTITAINSGIYWTCYPNQTVYVSHVNGKLKVAFCNLQMSGSNGTSFTTVTDGNIIETP